MHDTTLPAPLPADHALLTNWGTCVYLDPATGALRHGAPGAVPDNLRARLTADRATLLHCLPGGGLVPVPGGSFTMHPLEDGRLALQRDGRFACADDMLHFVVDRDTPRDWEHFKFISTADLAVLAALAGNDWVLDCGAENRILRRGSVAADTEFRLRVGAEHFPLSPGLPELVIEAGRSADGALLLRRVLCIRPDATILVLARFRPLLYWCVFGRDELFEMMALSIASLHEFGAYEGDILVISDREPEDVRRYVPAALHARLRTARLPDLPWHRLMFGRYLIQEYGLEQYQPLGYLDGDVIIDRSLDDVLGRVAMSDRLWLASEQPAEYRPQRDELAGGWFGKLLFDRDATTPATINLSNNTGVFLFPNIATVATLLALMRRYINMPDAWGEFVDQGPCNYVLGRTRAVATERLNPFIALLHAQEGRDARHPLGFAHFLGGIGRTWLKLPPMQAYIEELRAVAAERQDTELVD